MRTQVTRKGDTFTNGSLCHLKRESYALMLGRQEGRGLLLGLLFLHRLQLKVILVLKWHFGGWHMPIP